MFQRLKHSLVQRLGIERLAQDIDALSRALHDESARLRDLTAANDRVTGALIHLEHRVSIAEARDRIVFATWWAATAPLRHEPLISVVLPTRNRSELLVSSIASVFDQTYEHWQLVIVNDGSSDATADLLHTLDDDRITICTATGVGAPAARNIGVEAAAGDYVAFLDDDNSMAPGWLRAIAEFTGRAPTTRALYGVGLRDDDPTSDLVPWVLFEESTTPELLRERNSIDTGVLAVRRDHPELHFDETLDHYEDWDLAVRLAEAGEFRELPVFAGIYSTRSTDRVSTRAASDRLTTMQRQLRR